MENLIYFPTFEPPSDTWLKFALLYMDNFSPIIPDSGRQQLSLGYRKIIDETDLITPYKPHYDQGDRASVKAIEFIDRLQNDRYRYSNLFNRANIIRNFTVRQNRQFKIYREKYSNSWADYCLINNFGDNTNGGILVTEELAFIYMTFLAEEIAYEEGKSIITDNNKFDNFLNFKQTVPRQVFHKQIFAQTVMGLVIPKNISTIPLKNLIKFRNNNIRKIRAFNRELNISLDNIQEGINEREFVDRFNRIYSDLTKEILAQGLGIATIPLATYILMNQNASTPEYINEIIGGLGLILTAGLATGGRWRKIADKHNCKRYLTNLGRLQ